MRQARCPFRDIRRGGPTAWRASVSDALPYLVAIQDDRYRRCRNYTIAALSKR